jgi:N-acetylglucosaminyldiphosphoundecaprenol N-acetyl-beta-D-mannosaminyltransferase
MATVDLAGILIDNLTINEALAKVGNFLTANTPHLIVTPNPEIIVDCQNNQGLKDIINQADLRVADGISLIVVSKLLGKPIKERVTGIDLMQKVIELAAKQGYSIFLLGSAPGVAEKAAIKLREKEPNLIITGTHHGYFNDADDYQIIKTINAAKSDILFVGLGAGRQERWLSNNLDKLGVKIGMAIGGSLDVLSGRKNRAPKWVQSLYIEWLYRLFTEPQRWRRQLALPKFLWLMFKPTNFPKIN